MMELIRNFFGLIESLTWGWALIPILVVFGLLMTLVSGFVQIRFFGRMFRVLSSKNQTGDPNAISAREALLVSVGGRVGGGNIAGVAVAITLGGPGAVFWMWAIALVGMATSLVECSLAQLFKRSVGDGTYRGGPAGYIIHGLGPRYRWLAVVYAVCLIASFAFRLQCISRKHVCRRGGEQSRGRTSVERAVSGRHYRVHRLWRDKANRQGG
jgi:alanine or glycine:cation symporter, AGCS family